MQEGLGLLGPEASPRIAVKRLSAVEVDAEASHQREFHGDRLRRELGFPEDGASDRLTAVFYGATPEPEVDETTYTLYQARKPPRSEYRLYPATRLFQERASEGDLMVVFRRPGTLTLSIIVAAQGSAFEAELLETLFADDAPSLETFEYVESGQSGGAMLRAATVLTPPGMGAPTYDVEGHILFRAALADQGIPSTRQMADAAQELVVERHGRELDPDRLLPELLTAETELFYAIESKVVGDRLEAMIARSGANLSDVLEFAKSALNSRASRRGHSLQNHFQYTLDREHIPYTPQCDTGKPPSADIMVPGCEDYHDVNRPDEKKRMVSLKTTLRERWYETVPECARIRTKYLLTVDEDLTESKVIAMYDQAVSPFLPQRVIDGYPAGPLRLRLNNVAKLVDELRAVLP